MIQEYANGNLGSSFRLYRARVEGFDAVGGKFAQDPPNPPRSIRARVYTQGMDAALPEIALSIFYPIFPSVTAQQGEHVLVFFEDERRTSGYWLNTIPAFSSDINYSNPDFRLTNNRRDSSYVFEQDPVVRSTINLDLEYGGASIATQGRQEMVDLAESQTTDRNPWAGKRVLLIGDSQVAGPWGAKLGEILRNENQTSYFHRDGRTGWGVISWINGRLNASSQRQSLLSEVITQHTPDVLVISLGGNDGSSGRARASDYSDKIRELLAQASGVPNIIWSGPPTAVGRGSSKQAGRLLASQKIESVVGNRFVNVFAITNTENGRSPDGVHFTSRSTALEPWAQAVVAKGVEIL
jgi:lysophospholipase L1-like esterase